MPSSIFQVDFILRNGYQSLSAFHGARLRRTVLGLWALPFTVALWVVVGGVGISRESASSLLAALAILTGLLFSAIPLVVSLDSQSPIRPLRRVKAQAVSAVVDWLAYCCLVSIASLLPTTYVALWAPSTSAGVLHSLAVALSAAICIHLLLALLAAVALIAALLHRHTRDGEIGTSGPESTPLPRSAPTRARSEATSAP